MVGDSSQTGEARRLAISAASHLKFSATQQGRVGIVASELASNLAKHSHGGEFLVQEIRCGERPGLELMTIDNGPGITDLGIVMRDGYSSAGSSGTGLGALKRLSSTFDIYSQQGKGSVFVAQLWASDTKCIQGGIEYGVVSVPHPGEQENGDGWLIDDLGGGRYLAIVVDGLGHGQLACDASRMALESYRKAKTPEPAKIIEYCHGSLRSTRGAAMAVALLDAGKRTVHYAGVGNIVGAVVAHNGVRRMVSHDGTVGHTIRKIHEFTYEWSKEALLIMHSDGLSANWNLERYAGLLIRHTSVIAGVLYRDSKRRNDDATVLVVRET